MKITQRKYVGKADTSAMMQLAQAHQTEHIHGIDLPYRFSSWAWDDPDNISLWVDESGMLVGWAVMQTPFWSIDVVLHPDVEGILFPEILTWIDQQAMVMNHTRFGLPSWFINVFADQTQRRQALENAGFVSQADAGKDAWSKVWLELDGDIKVPASRLPDGFCVRPLGGDEEVAAYVALHQAVFQTKNMTTEWRMRTLTAPGYIPDLDMVIADPDGRLVAFCIGWLSKSWDGTLLGQVEPLGCHEDYRKYRMGWVVLCETLHRLRAKGAVKIYVETDNYRNSALRLYQSVGFQVVRDILVYRKDYNLTEE
jgi:ribosomal protein S18 acetylase RimI-like enzyme